MNLSLHLLLHILLSLLAGLIVWRIGKKPVASFVAAIAGGVFIDLDHFIDYFLAFGWSFDLAYFLHGYQFLESNKIYILFHGWEYVVILALIGYLVRSTICKSVLFACALGMFFHLAFDASANEGATIKGYSVFYRATYNFDVQDIVTREHYERHQITKKTIYEK